MDADRFEAAARWLISGLPRRNLLAGLSGSFLTGLSWQSVPTEVEARKKRKRKNKPCCKADCAGKVCGDDGCGGVCGFVCQESEPGKICCEGACKYPNGTPGCCIPSGEVCTPEGVTHGSYVCCSKSCDIGNTNLCD